MFQNVRGERKGLKSADKHRQEVRKELPRYRTNSLRHKRGKKEKIVLP
jgi:hypothetical protein